MAALGDSDVYFRIGVPFEGRWMGKISRLDRGLVIIDLRDGLELRDMEPSPGPSEARSKQGLSEHSDKDPHVWLNPMLVAQMARSIRDVLSRRDPEFEDGYSKNCDAFVGDLEKIDHEIREELRTVSRREFFVYHPSLGYFADAYGLTQVPIERYGREPGPRTLQSLIDRGKLTGVRTVFVQQQAGTRNAETVARSLGASIVVFDPLAEDYLANLANITSLLSKALR